MRDRLRVLLLALASFCLGMYTYSYFDRTIYQAYEEWRFDHALRPNLSAGAFLCERFAGKQTEHLAGRTKAQNSFPITVLGHEESKPAAGHLPLLSTIGRISIPRLHFSAMVREGVDDGVLQLAVGHIPATALPGQAGNVGIAGHRDTFFRQLKNVRRNDEIDFRTMDGDFKYQVESLTVVDPENASSARPLPR